MKKEDKHVSDLGKDLERQSFAARYYRSAMLLRIKIVPAKYLMRSKRCVIPLI